MSLFCFKFPSRIPYFAYLLCLYRVSLAVTVYIDFSLFLMTLTLLRCTGQVSYRMSLNWGWSGVFLMGGLELRILEGEKLVEIICHFQGSDSKESSCNAGDLGLIPGLGRIPGEVKGDPLQYSGLENPMDCIIHLVTKSWTRLSDFHFHFSSHCIKGTYCQYNSSLLMLTLITWPRCGVCQSETLSIGKSPLHIKKTIKKFLYVSPVRTQFYLKETIPIMLILGSERLREYGMKQNYL